MRFSIIKCYMADFLNAIFKYTRVSAGSLVTNNSFHSPLFPLRVIATIQVVKNAQCMAKRFMDNGFRVVSGGTDNHLVLVDFRDKKINGARVDLVLDDVSIAGNKNTCPGTAL